MPEWKLIPGYSNYEVSSDGDVRRAVEGQAKNHWAHKGRVRVRSIGKIKGRVKLRLFNDEHKKFMSVNMASLVLLAFVGPKPSLKHHAAHRDDNRLNDRLENLYWATAKQNKADAIRNGRTARGERSPRAKLTEAEIRRIRAAEGVTSTELAKQFNMSRSVIYAIRNRQIWKHVID